MVTGLPRQCRLEASSLTQHLVSKSMFGSLKTQALLFVYELCRDIWGHTAHNNGESYGKENMNRKLHFYAVPVQCLTKGAPGAARSGKGLHAEVLSSAELPFLSHSWVGESPKS